MNSQYGSNPDPAAGLNTWKAATTKVRTDSSHVDVWRIPTLIDETQLAYFESVLSKPQRERAARLRIAEKRHQYIIAHGLTRHILGHALSVSPADIEFSRGPRGKPYVGGELAAEGLQFNMTHTSHVALVAVTREREVGIDIEHVRENLQWEKLAKRYFSPMENQLFERQPVNDRLRAFFVCWTRKEAVLKAIGTGIGGGLGSFDVNVDPASAPRLLGNRWNGRFHGDWSMTNLDVGGDYVATLVSERDEVPVRCWHVDPGDPI